MEFIRISMRLHPSQNGVDHKLDRLMLNVRKSRQRPISAHPCGVVYQERSGQYLPTLNFVSSRLLAAFVHRHADSVPISAASKNGQFLPAFFSGP